jgi:hypothetical protein
MPSCSFISSGPRSRSPRLPPIPRVGGPRSLGNITLAKEDARRLTRGRGRAPLQDLRTPFVCPPAIVHRHRARHHRPDRRRHDGRVHARTRRAAPAAAVPGIWSARDRPGQRSARRDGAVLSRCSTAPGRTRKLRAWGLYHTRLHRRAGQIRQPAARSGHADYAKLFSLVSTCSAVHSCPTMHRCQSDVAVIGHDLWLKRFETPDVQQKLRAQAGER